MILQEAIRKKRLRLRKSPGSAWTLAYKDYYPSLSYHGQQQRIGIARVPLLSSQMSSCWWANWPRSELVWWSSFQRHETAGSAGRPWSLWPTDSFWPVIANHVIFMDGGSYRRRKSFLCTSAVQRKSDQTVSVLRILSDASYSVEYMI